MDAHFDHYSHAAVLDAVQQMMAADLESDSRLQMSRLV